MCAPPYTGLSLCSWEERGDPPVWSLGVGGGCQARAVCTQSFNPGRLFVTPWALAHQTPLSIGFSRQENWSGLPCPPAGDLRNPGIELVSFMSPALAGRILATSTTWEALVTWHGSYFPRCAGCLLCPPHLEISSFRSEKNLREFPSLFFIFSLSGIPFG